MRAMDFALCLAVTLCLSAPAFAQAERTKPAGSVGGAVQGSTMAPPATAAKPADIGRPGRAAGATTALPLTESECGSLGGTVKDNITACMSGKACQTTGEDKQVRAVCISKK